MIKLKMDVLNALKDVGVTAYSAKTTKALPQGTFTKLKALQSGTYAELSMTSIDKICSILQCQPGDLLEWVPDEE